MSPAFVTLLIVGAIPTVSCAAAAALAVTYYVNAGADLRARVQQSQALTEASQQYRTARSRCELLAGMAKDVCVGKAKAAEKHARAEAQSIYPGASLFGGDVRIATAQGDYLVASARCNAQPRNERRLCLRAAKATQTEAVANAQAGRVAMQARADGH